MAKRVFLSPSDHGENQNKCLHSGCYEDKHTRPIAEVCAKHLQNSGVEVRIGTANQKLLHRCWDSDDFKADLHVPIHTNAASNPDVRYLMFMFYADSKKYRKVFDAVAPELEAVYPGNKKSVYDVRKDLVEVNRPCAVSLYCELGFHTNPTDCDEFIHETETVGKALAKGICKYLGVTFCEAEPAEKAEDTYTLEQFVREVQEACGAAVNGVPDAETLHKTVTVSATKNRTHAVVKPVQKRLSALGYTEVGKADGIAGAMFTSALAHFQRDNECFADGEAAEWSKTWHKLLGVS
jgi:N-acetylmuramoyl-L-alanine amidase